MIKFKLLFTLAMFILLLLILIGCTNGTDDNKPIEQKNESQSSTVEIIKGVVVVSEKTLPSNFYEIAFERETVPKFQYLIRKAVNQSEFEQAWTLFGFENKLANVDFNEKDVFFIGVHESGSCPYEVENVELSPDKTTMTVPMSEPEGACTSDATPRTFVIQIDKQISTEIENVVIVQSGIETDVPFES